ncbi:MAG: SWIM zinc finger family protein [Planctomycetaceae bacterium]
MIEIDASYVDAAAPNADAIRNGRGLVLKNKLVILHKSADETLLFGECSGSGKSNYRVSVDFMRPDQPTYRCSCPSRQFPCKHSLGLMYAWVDGKKFTVADVPPDIADKREKLVQRVEKKKEAAKTPKKVNKSALAKKIKVQLEGLDLLEKLTFDLIRMGMGNTTAKTARQIEDQARQLGNSYLPGAQAALHNYTRLFVSADGRFDADVPAAQREKIYSEALDQLNRLQSLTKQGRTYLSSRLNDPELAPETESAIAAWLGHAWQLAELIGAGLVENDAELLQLAFNSYDDVARSEYVDTGYWMNLKSGKIQQTQTFRPYKAAKFIKGEDSFFKVAQVKELCVYPGTVNPRIRWDGMVPRELNSQDLSSVRKHAHSDFASLIKEVKGHLKMPLVDKRPVYALSFEKLGDVDGHLVAEDGKGERLVLTETGMAEEPASVYLLGLLPRTLLSRQTMLVRFHHDLDTRQLRIKPLSIVTPTEVVRLTF